MSCLASPCSLGVMKPRLLGVQIDSWAYVESEMHMYTAMSSHDYPDWQKSVTAAFEESFEILDEARILMHCRSLPGVISLEGVCITTYPCRRVSSLLFEYLARGDLGDLIMCVSHLSHAHRVAVLHLHLLCCWPSIAVKGTDVMHVFRWGRLASICAYEHWSGVHGFRHVAL